MTEESSATFGDDAPKKTPADDRLNYAPFARRVADAIVDLDAPGGYVIGIHGEWGSGKSTVLNFVADYLSRHNDENRDDRVVTIEFRPWLITGNHDLIAAYFKVLSEALDGTAKKRWWKRRPWERLQNARARLLVDAAAKVGLAVADPSGTALISTLAATAANTASELTAQVRENPSLQKAYEDLRDKLRDSGQRYLVLIDDIDRLGTGDVRSIMQMVKSVGQLPNVIYLLAYDRDIVWSAFGGKNAGEGPSFAEKIVQQELQLPVPSQSRLLRMLDGEIAFVLEGQENSLRWEIIVQDGLRRWIRSPRDVVRLSNAVKFTWSALKREIDPQDLLAMEGLRLFDYNVFEWLRDHRAFLFTAGRFQLADEDLIKQTVGGLERMVSDEAWSQIRPLVTQLFPQLTRHFNDPMSVGGIDWDEVQKRRGTGSEAGYDSYFGLYPSADAIPLAVVNRLVSGAQDSETIESCLQEYLRKGSSDGDPLVEVLLGDLLIRYRGRDAAQPRQAMLNALFAVGEEVIDLDYEPGRGGTHPSRTLESVIREMLCRWGPNDAGARLIDAFVTVDSPAFPANVYISRGRELGVFDSGSDMREKCPITEKDFRQLGEILMTRIRRARDNGSLERAPYYYSIVRAWSHLATPEEPKNWLMQGVVQSEDFMAKTCYGLVGVGPDRDGNRWFEMSDRPDPMLYDVETLLVAGRAHLSSELLTDDIRRRITAVVRGCENLLNKPDKGGND